MWFCSLVSKVSEIFHNKVDREARLNIYSGLHQVYVSGLERAVALRGRGERVFTGATTVRHWHSAAPPAGLLNENEEFENKEEEEAARRRKRIKDEI